MSEGPDQSGSTRSSENRDGGSGPIGSEGMSGNDNSEHSVDQNSDMMDTDNSEHAVDQNLVSDTDRGGDNVGPGVLDSFDDNSEGDDQGQPYYEIEKIVGKKYSQAKGQWLYRVKWRTFPARFNSWVLYDDLNPTCQKYVTEAGSAIPNFKKSK